VAPTPLSQFVGGLVRTLPFNALLRPKLRFHVLNLNRLVRRQLLLPVSDNYFSRAH
jgi:hypothetical protein